MLDLPAQCCHCLGLLLIVWNLLLHLVLDLLLICCTLRLRSWGKSCSDLLSASILVASSSRPTPALALLASTEQSPGEMPDGVSSHTALPSQRPPRAASSDRGVLVREMRVSPASSSVKRPCSDYASGWE
ncbi:hypothetical protein BV898_17288 [Hypsibius exemplaris]|uniref:Uncharacterized protein n=1 Tax=Hypsibius exemplaris TaxID=2072580 RepID=A0A9X6NHT4_HYPEX|nr:hypothetical protein BV898_17288 [Hypsibius exemplaris]